jgi:4-carboxymuconolactone decarboxylase
MGNSRHPRHREREVADSKLEKGQQLLGVLLAGGGGGAVPLPADFTRYSVEHLFGDVWQGPDLTLPERSLITCSVLVALARDEEQRTHFRIARNLGVSRPKLEAMITHVAHYAGWPVASSALRTLHEVWEAMDREADARPRDS